MNLFEGGIEIIGLIWRGYREMQDNSVVGPSELDKRSGRLVRWICGGLMTGLIVAGITWAWLVKG